MTYQKIKTTLVDERKQLSTKALIGMLIRLILALIGALSCLAVVITSTLGNYGFGISVISFILGVVVFNSLIDLCLEDEQNIKRVNLFSRFWFIFYILFVIIVLTLSALNFI